MDNSVPQAMSSPSSMDIDVELTHRVIDPPTQQSPSDGPALPCDDDSNQVSSSAKVSLGLSSVTLPIRSRRTTNIKQIQSPSAAPVLATAPASSFMGTGSLALAFRPIQAAPSAPSRQRGRRPPPAKGRGKTAGKCQKSKRSTARCSPARAPSE